MLSTRYVAILALVASPAFAQEQSPIDITSEAARYKVLPALVFNYGTSVPLELENNGSPDPEKTVRANVTAGNSLTIAGESFDLLQFHFHVHSEHCIHGMVKPMEAHFVHQNASGEYTVVGRFIEIGAENALLAPIFSNLPASGATFDIASFDLSALVPADLRSFRYTGSLTTPGFTEGVNWVLLNEPLFLSAAQIGAFEALFPLPVGNFREKQELNGRRIWTDVEGFAVPAPASVSLMLFGLGMIAARGPRRPAA